MAAAAGELHIYIDRLGPSLENRFLLVRRINWDLCTLCMSLYVSYSALRF